MKDAWFWMAAGVSFRSLAAALLVGCALTACRVRAATVRHASWTAVLVAMLLMPVLVRLVPAIAVPMSPRIPAVLSFASMETDREIPAGLTPGISTDSGSSGVNGVNQIDVSVSRQPAPIQPATSRVTWLAMALGLYVIGAVAMLTRFIAGWLGAVRIVAESARIDLAFERLALAPGGEIDVRESSRVAVPVTLGLVRQTILLPAVWRRWPSATLAAVLAHELAHVRRRDPVVAFAAHLNCCVFWFHPLSWWLERTLASSAEQAADEEAVALLGDRAAYAEILLDMARAVVPAAGRIVWLGVGIGGSGVLRDRIACVLSGVGPGRVPAQRKAMLAVSCAIAILLAVACRPSAMSLGEDAPLEQRDRVLHLRVLQVAESEWRHFSDIDWDAEADALASREAALAQDPDNLTALQRFLVSYWARYACQAVAGCGNPFVTNHVVDRRLLAVRRTYILRLIEQHPESFLAGAVEARIFPHDLEPFFPGDPVGYAQAKDAWIEQTRRPDVGAEVLGHAAAFFATADKPLAEQTLLRARAADPEGRWTARLGQLYRDVFLGSEVISGRNSRRMVSAGEPRSPYAVALREKLARSTDEELLAATGWFLSGSSGRPWMDVDPAPWAEACLTRALQINPRAVFAHTALLNLRRQMKNAEPFWRVAPASRDAYLAALPERQRFEELPSLARNSYRTISELGRWNDSNLQGRLELERAQAERYARDALALAPRFTDDPDYGTAIYTANMTLSALALRTGDHKASILYLERASAAPPSEQLAYGDDVVWHRLVRELVDRGERQAAIAYLEGMARTNIAGRIELREWAEALRRDAL